MTHITRYFAIILSHLALVHGFKGVPLGLGWDHSSLEVCRKRLVILGVEVSEGERAPRDQPENQSSCENNPMIAVEPTTSTQRFSKREFSEPFILPNFILSSIFTQPFFAQDI